MCKKPRVFKSRALFGFLNRSFIPLHSLFGVMFFSRQTVLFHMFAIVSIAGQQFKVEEGQRIFVHRLAAQEGESVSFDTVHLIDRGAEVSIGTPYVSGAQITATVLGHLKGDKVIVFHKKRRKGYRKKKGHRQCFTQLQITSIAG